MNNLDLTYLTAEEIEHLHGVLTRAQAVENEHNTVQSSSDQATGSVPSHQVFQSTWKDTHGVNSGSYQSATELVRAALTGGDETSQNSAVQENVGNAASPPITPTSPGPSVKSSSSAAASGGENSLKAQISDSGSHHSVLKSPKRSNGDNFGIIFQPLTPTKKVTFVKPTIAVDGRPLSMSTQYDGDDAEDRDILTPLVGYTSPTSPKGYDTKSMVSRTSTHLNDFVGEIKISLIFYPPGKALQDQFPAGRATRLPEGNHLDVLTRKTYAALSGSRIRVVRESRTGAKPEDDGELHLLINDAYNLRLPSGMSKRRPRTYVKCYLLPDRYHGSKMRSDVVRDTTNPVYEHKFIFRGFSREEFYGCAIEIVIGGITSGRGRHLVVGGVRLSGGNKNSVNAIPWKNSNEEEVNLWQEAFEKPCIEITNTLALRPRIKLTYK